MNNQGAFKNGRDRATSLLSPGGVQRGDLEARPDHLLPNRLVDLVGSLDFAPAGPMLDEDAQPALVEVAEGAQATTEPADDDAESASAPSLSTPEDDGPSTAEVGEVGSAHRMLAMAQKLHDEYVSEGHNTRERLINEGQSSHDRVVAEATARHDELLSTGQAKYDALIDEAEALVDQATAEHDRLILEARQRSAEMVAAAEQEKAEVLQGLSNERALEQKEIEELQTFEHDHRARLKDYLTAQLIELEQTVTEEAA